LIWVGGGNSYNALIVNWELSNREIVVGSVIGRLRKSDCRLPIADWVNQITQSPDREFPMISRFPD